MNPIALAKIGYYFYIFYLGVLILATSYIYLFFPETKGLTLEELSHRSLNNARWLEASVFRKADVLNSEDGAGAGESEAEMVKVDIPKFPGERT